nr:folliculin-like isoform X2 [Cherax quadricarinatus]
MNAIVSICHFCELHGPSVVFCTQAFRDLLDLDALTDAGALEILNSRNLEDEEQLKAEETNLWKYGRIHKETYARSKSTSNDTCVACRSFSHIQPGFISNDDSARVSYVSAQYPLQSELYILVREACIRSLSCEVCPGREGPIYFGDESRGHVVSHTFFLRDVQARGFQRWYSILILMKDKMLLLNSWPFIVRHLRQTITHLQENAYKVYQNEESKVSHRSLRSAVFMDNFRKQRVTGQPRSLSELVGEREVWQHLHSSFTWLLKAGGLRLQERLIEGPPVNIYIADGSGTGNGLSVRELYNTLGGSIFHRMMHHLLIGRQVILRGSSTKIISALIHSLQPLLPKHCYKAIQFSPHYIAGTSCNILGLQSLITDEGSLPSRPPQVLNRIESAVCNSTITPSALMIYISTVIYEWINKVKVWIHVQNLKKMSNSHPERIPSPVNYSQSVTRTSPIPILRGSTNSLSRSPVMPAFRSASPGTLNSVPQELTPQDERHQLLAALGSTEWDVPLLEFWAKNFNQISGQEVC